MLKGKGFLIWQIPRCEGGDATKIAEVAKAANYTHIVIKIADGTYPYNINSTTKKDMVPAVANALRAKGIEVWGWHYIYGNNPTGEASIAAQRVKGLNLNGYVIDAEIEFQQPGMDKAATTFMSALRKSLPSTPIALCSFRYPSYHPQFPWSAFLDKCDYNMPQVYWQESHNAGAQLTRSFNEFQTLKPVRPYIPMGPMYGASGWSPSASEVLEFMNTAISLNISGANFFTWDYRSRYPAVWNTIAAYPWSSGNTNLDIPEKFIAAMNSKDPQKVAALYTSEAIRIAKRGIIQGQTNLLDHYKTMLNTTLPNGEYKLSGKSGSGASRHFTWTCTAASGKVTDGYDTVGIVGDKIIYHFSYYTIQQ
ncbi:MAG: hypothetical protein HPY76_11945 [Anaerolineae bacterium]|nr:hypothetical protein [Anaerolineae bacterium]